jgi:hypothetical protein
VYEKLDMQKINTLIEDTLFISKTHKRFYQHMLSARFELIIKESFELLEEDTK